MKFIFTKKTLGKIKNCFSIMALSFLFVGTAQADIVEFNTEANACNAILSWVSDGDSDISSYEVQKSLNGINFSTITTIRRVTSNNYEYTTRQTEDRAHYRIVENHTSTFPSASAVKVLKTNCNTGIIDAPAIGFYPNPMLASIGGDLHITLENEGAKMLSIQITDITGRVILKQENELHQGLNQIDMNVNELTVGSYLIVTSADGATPKATRFIVQK